MTAVEFIEQQIKWRTNIVDIIAEAKEMEKQQIIDSANHGANFESSPFKDAEDYYNQTYKK